MIPNTMSGSGSTNGGRDPQLAMRHNTGKTEWSQIDWPTLEGMVRVLMYGAQKYARNNWKKGQPYTEVADSLMRHLTAFLQGEDTDSESGLHHLDHVACNVHFLRYHTLHHPQLDDRPKPAEP